MLKRSRPLLVVYFPVADPEVSIEVLVAYARCGVDVVEFGWPARDPYLDGTDVRASMARARRDDPASALRDLSGRLAGFPDAPKALLMTYAEADHPALADVAFFRGQDAVLVVASPSDPSRLALEARAKSSGVAISAFVPLPLDQVDVEAARRADFYVMLQAAPGVTGPRAALDESNAERVARLRRAGVSAPILLGFGISERAQARKAVEFGADGIVVGSAALRAARQGRATLEDLLMGLRDGLDG